MTIMNLSVFLNELILYKCDLKYDAELKLNHEHNDNHLQDIESEDEIDLDLKNLLDHEVE